MTATFNPQAAIKALTLTAALVLLAAPASATSYHKARISTERVVCSYPKIGALDEQVAGLYLQLHASCFGDPKQATKHPRSAQGGEFASSGGSPNWSGKPNWGGLLIKASASAESVTLDNYMRMKMGSSYAEVAKVMGGPGEEMSRLEAGAYSTLMQSWSVKKGFGMVTGTFIGDKLYMRLQIGLTSGGDIPKISLSKYMQLKMGSSYAEVVKVMGSPGVETSRGEIPGDTSGNATIAMQWTNDFDFSSDNHFGIVSVTFANDKLIARTQIGLKDDVPIEPVKPVEPPPPVKLPSNEVYELTDDLNQHPKTVWMQSDPKFVEQANAGIRRILPASKIGSFSSLSSATVEKYGLKAPDAVSNSAALLVASIATGLDAGDDKNKEWLEDNPESMMVKIKEAARKATIVYAHADSAPPMMVGYGGGKTVFVINTNYDAERQIESGSRLNPSGFNLLPYYERVGVLVSKQSNRNEGVKMLLMAAAAHNLFHLANDASGGMLGISFASAGLKSAWRGAEGESDYGGPKASVPKHSLSPFEGPAKENTGGEFDSFATAATKFYMEGKLPNPVMQTWADKVLLGKIEIE